MSKLLSTLIAVAFAAVSMTAIAADAPKADSDHPVADMKKDTAKAVHKAKHKAKKAKAEAKEEMKEGGAAK